MTIADEIRRVATQFVPGRKLFAALCAAEGVNEYQAASWFLRHMDELEEYPVYAFNYERHDFYLADDGWASDLFGTIVHRDEEGETEPMWFDDMRQNYLLGWLQPDLEKFFLQAGVSLPAAALEPIGEHGSTATSHLPAALINENQNDESADLEGASQKADKPGLATKERTTLLCIIGTIAREAKFDISRTTKAATIIVDSAAAVGIKLGQRTVEEWLKRVPDALERRST